MGMHPDCGHGIPMATSMAQLRMQVMKPRDHMSRDSAVQTASTSAGAAVVPLECIFAFRPHQSSMPPRQRLKLSGCITHTSITTGRPGKNAGKRHVCAGAEFQSQ